MPAAEPLARAKPGSPQALPGRATAPPLQRLMQPRLHCQQLLPTIRLELTLSCGRPHAGAQTRQPHSQGGLGRDPHELSHHSPVPSHMGTSSSPPPLACTMVKPLPTLQPEAKSPSGAVCILATAPSGPGSPTEQPRLAPARTRLPDALPDDAAFAASWQQAPRGQSVAKPIPSMSTALAMGRSRRLAAAGAMAGCPRAGSPWQGSLSSPWPPARTGC